MFILRCVFFLSIVYASIGFGSGRLRDTRAFEATVASEMSGIVGSVTAQATDWCAERRVRCARDAARLNALVETTMAEPLSGGDEEVIGEAEAPRTPLPVPDPRRRGARTVLTAAH